MNDCDLDVVENKVRVDLKCLFVILESAGIVSEKEFDLSAMVVDVRVVRVLFGCPVEIKLSCEMTSEAKRT